MNAVLPEALAGLQSGSKRRRLSQVNCAARRDRPQSLVTRGALYSDNRSKHDQHRE